MLGYPQSEESIADRLLDLTAWACHNSHRQPRCHDRERRVDVAAGFLRLFFADWALTPTRQIREQEDWSRNAWRRSRINRRRTLISCKSSLPRNVSESSFGSHGPTALPLSSRTRTSPLVSGSVSAAETPMSGLGAEPAAGMSRLEKSGVSPGRNRGSGTWSFSSGLFGFIGVLSAIRLSRLIVSRASGNHARQVCFTLIDFPASTFAKGRRKWFRGGIF